MCIRDRLIDTASRAVEKIELNCIVRIEHLLIPNERIILSNVALAVISIFQYRIKDLFEMRHESKDTKNWSWTLLRIDCELISDIRFGMLF